ncbi:hypothetical protein ES705_47721 [subsurface metagenome]
MELLNENTKFTGKIIISKDLKRYKEKYLQSTSLPTKIKNFILKEFFEIPRKECAEKLCMMSNIFSKSILTYNYEYLERLSQEIESERLKDLMNYYNDNLFPLYDQIAESENGFLLRIGAGTDWHSKTIGLEIMDYFLENKGMNFSNFYDRINKLQLFKGKQMHKHFRLMPISRKFIVDTSKNPQYPIGWVKARIIDS